MFVGFLSWWYGAGLTSRIDGAGERLARVGDFFSVGLLAATLFTPFRQLDTGRVRGPLGVQLHAALDNLISRLIGAFIRLTMIVVAGFAFMAAALYGVSVVLGWLVLPVVPLIGGLIGAFGMAL